MGKFQGSGLRLQHGLVKQPHPQDLVLCQILCYSAPKEG